MHKNSAVNNRHPRPARGLATRAYHWAIAEWLRVTTAVAGAGTGVYVAVASLIGVDALTLLVGAAAIWPFGISLLLAALALVYYARVYWRRRRQ